jgi:predicted secreted protein
MAGLSAYGTQLKIGGTAGTAVVNVTNIDGPGMSADTIDVSAHDTGDWRDYVAGPLDGGEVTLRLNFDPGTATHANTTGLLDYFQDRASASYALVFPDNTTYTFTAYVTAFQPTAPFDEKLEATCTLKITGAVTLA